MRLQVVIWPLHMPCGLMLRGLPLMLGMSAALRLMPIGSRSDSRHKIGDSD